MKLKYEPMNFVSGRPIAFLDGEFARKFGIVEGSRLEVVRGKRKLVLVCNLIGGKMLSEKKISFSKEAIAYLKVKKNDKVEVSIALEPRSTKFILKKMNNAELKKEEIFAIVNGIVHNELNEAEIAYFVAAIYENGMTLKETIYLTEAMVKTGAMLKWHEPKVVDKHSIGGVAGNGTTPIVVSICAATGIIFPKTSSRAVTSAAGTADVVETLTNVAFSYEELKKIVKKVGACLAWGGSLGLAPADDKIIRVERLINLDPESNFISSILAKKISVGSKYILIDIPYGNGAKVSLHGSKELARKFTEIGKHFGLKIHCVATDGSEPIGNGVGPILGMIDVLKVLQRKNPPMDLEKKSVFLAGKILEMMKKAKKNQGEKLAQEILNSKKALKKFNEIVDAQGRKKVNLKPGEHEYKLRAAKSEIIKHIDNKRINFVAKILGCPTDKAAGIYIHKKKGERVKAGETILTLYAESRKKLREGIEIEKELKPVIVKD